MSREHLYLIDGSGFIFRAFHALPPLTRPDGTPVGAVLGFCNMLYKILGEHQATHLAVIFDAARKTFRNDIYKEYKAHRPPPPPELIPQFELIREATTAFNVAWVDKDGYEADDLIATYTRLGRESDMEITIVSSDKDLMQLVTPDVTLYDHFKNRRIGPHEVIEKYGVPPEKMIDIQALMGDSSDNVPGVPKIGPKTAAELILKFDTLENLLNHLDEIPQKGRRENLENNAELARISYKLVTLDQNTPLDKELNELRVQDFDVSKAIQFLDAQNFKQLRARISNKEPQKEKPKTTYQTLQTREDLENWTSAAKKAAIIAIDTETTGLDPNRVDLVGISASFEEGQGIYIPLGHDPDLGQQIALSDAQLLLSPLLSDSALLKVGHNIKYDLHILTRHGFDVEGIEDSMLISYLLDNGKHGHSLDELARLHCDHDMIAFKDVAGTGRTQKLFSEVPLDQATDYAAEDADFTLRLYNHLKPRIAQERLTKLYETIERPLVTTLFTMERKGVLLDETALDKAGQKFEANAKQLEEEIYRLAGENFNIASPKQMGEILFDKMKLPAPKKGKSGSYETHVDVLEKLAADGHLIAEKILGWRQLTKLLSTYVVGLKEAVNPKTKRVHTSYGMTMTSTGRLNSSNPNLQNIPVRTLEGQEIRKCFIAKPGSKLVKFDYSQIELRLMAEFANVEGLKDAFRNGIDIHTRTASQIFGIPEKEIDSTTRRKAKAINFGIIYGISGFGLGKQLGISTKEADAYIKTYFEAYPEIKDYMESTKALCKKQGYVSTLYGRKCYIPGITSSNFAQRQFAERAAINAPLQGSNADIIKLAMNKIHRKFEKDNSVDMLLQVHDELVFEIEESAIEAVTPEIQKMMETSAELSIPLKVDVGVGENWQVAGG